MLIAIKPLGQIQRVRIVNEALGRSIFMTHSPHCAKAHHGSHNSASSAQTRRNWPLSAERAVSSFPLLGAIDQVLLYWFRRLHVSAAYD